MESFDDWVKTITHPCIQKWADRLLELGASWDSFRSRDPSDIINDLVSGGIPPLAANDICNIASEAITRSQAPMSIFWDIENVPIPAHVSGRDVAARLKSILAPLGRLDQFRGYASIGLNLIPQQKRSELQLSGCHLVDCPHVGRKEVADKMIIVDAMQFAFTHPEGATLCFVTGDVDYAYLLAVLQKKPQWRTIVISKGTMKSMLHVNCDMKMRWETDILQLRPSSSSSLLLFTPPRPPGFPPSQAAWNEVTKSGDPPQQEQTTFASILGSQSSSLETNNNELPQGLGVIHCDDNNSVASFEALTMAEEWMDDAQLLRSVVTNGLHIGSPQGTLKSLVGSVLRQTNPARFPSRVALQEFLAKAIESGVVVETGDGGDKALYLPADFKNNDGVAQPTISLSQNNKLPISIHEMPPKALEVSSIMPYILFVKKHRIPTGNKFPEKIFVQTSGKWMLLMFNKLTDSQRVVAAQPWLSHGVLVDWRRVSQTGRQGNMHSIEEIHEPILCTMCETLCERATEAFVEHDADELFCRTCFTTRHFWTYNEKTKAANKVVMMLEMMAENDDLYIPRGILRKSLNSRWHDCESRGQAAIWVEVAIEAGRVIELKQPQTKNKVIFLPENREWAMAPFPPSGADTSAEVEYVKELLWRSNNYMTRKEVIAHIKSLFPSMKSPLMRTKMFLSAAEEGLFFIAKNGNGQIVGLTKEDASAALDIAFGNGDLSTVATSVCCTEVCSIEENKRMESHIAPDRASASGSDSSSSHSIERLVPHTLK
jgi:hypothetical protein